VAEVVHRVVRRGDGDRIIGNGTEAPEIERVVALD
jgi:hypothetical protein